MPAPIRIEVELDSGNAEKEGREGGKKYSRGFASALDELPPAAQQAAKQIGSALNAGLGSAVEKARQDIGVTAKEVTDNLKRGVESGIGSFKEAGQRLGDALTAGLADAVSRARLLREQLDSALSPDRRIASIQAKEIAHQQRLSEIATKGAEQLAVIEARKDQQLAAIQARAEADQERHQNRLREIQQRNPGQLGQSLTQVGQHSASASPLRWWRSQAVPPKTRQPWIQLNWRWWRSQDQARKRRSSLLACARSPNFPGIGFEEAVQGSVRLQAVGFSAAESERALKAFANAVALTGGGKAQLSEITVQLGQLSSKGKVLAQDLRPIIEAAPAVGKALKAAFGTVSSEDISKQLEAAGKSSKDFIQILLTELEKFPQVAGGFRNVLDNFSDNATRAFASIGNAIFRILGPALDSLGDFLVKAADRFSALPESMQSTIILFGVAAAAIGPLLIAAGGLIIALSGLVKAWATVQIAFEVGGALAVLPALLNPVTLAIAALGAILGIAAIAYGRDTNQR